MQVPYFARYFRVVTFDPAGQRALGSSRAWLRLTHRGGRTPCAVLDATGTPRASLVCNSRSTWHGVILAARHPERVDRLVLVAHRARPKAPGARAFHERPRQLRGMGTVQRALLARALRGVCRVLLGAGVSPSPTRRSRARTAWTWGLETTPDILIATMMTTRITSRWPALARVRSLPTLIVHGTRTGPPPRPRRARSRGDRRLARWSSSRATGHAPGARQPVRYNLLAPRLLAGAGPIAPDVAAGAGAAEARPVRLEPDRPGPLPARHRDRPRAARARTLSSRSTGSPRIRSPACWRRGASMSTRRAGSSPASRLTWSPRPGSTTPRLPGLAEHGRDPARQLHGLRTTCSRPSRTISWSATRRGRSTTTSTRTRS